MYERRGKMYRTRQIRIKKGHRMYRYCRDICAASAKLYNRGNYLIRQYATALDRMERGEELTENQKEAYSLVMEITEGTKYEPKSRWLTYGQLDYVLKSSGDSAYRSLPAQANQQILRRIMRDYKSFFEAMKAYSMNPERFTGRPGMPRYRKKGSLRTALLTNQICSIKEGRCLKFPGTRDRVNIGRTEGEARLKEVRIKPHTDSFVLDVVLETAEPVKRDNPLCGMEKEELIRHLAEQDSSIYRLASIDPGVDNFCAVTNNFGERPFLVKGGPIKSANRYYNKRLAQIRSEAKRCNDTYRTKRTDRLHDRRNRIIKDMMHKISRRITDWAEENRVDLVVMGHNIYQKQSIELGHVNNQNIVQIPFQVFAGMLRYKLEEKGIALLDTEEAYTSKADFLAKDEMPEYHRGDSIPKMSGKRIQRGLYRHWNGWISNADINGAANILRKVLPNVKEWDRGVVDTPYAIRVA